MKKLLIICLSFVFIPNVSSAASSMDLGEYIEGMNVKTSDVKSLQRGARNFFNYCSGCHTLQYMRYNQIAEDLGITEDQLMQNLIFTESSPQNIVMNNMLKEDGDRWFGKAPPDLTLVTRRKSPEYVYGFLNSFYEDNNSPTGGTTVFPLEYSTKPISMSFIKSIPSNDFTILSLE